MKVTEFEKALNFMYADVYNHHTQLKEIQKTGVPQRAEELAAQMVQDAVRNMHSAKDVMVFITAIEMVREYIERAAGFGLGDHVYDFILPRLEQIFDGEVWLRERCELPYLELQRVFFDIRRDFERMQKDNDAG